MKSCVWGVRGSSPRLTSGIDGDASQAAALSVLPRKVKRAIQLRFHTWPESETIQLLSARRSPHYFRGGTLVKLRVTFWPETLIVFHPRIQEDRSQ